MTKLKMLLLLGIMLFPMRVCSQVKTIYADELAIDINGLKLGYIYTPEKIKSVLGSPTDTSSWEADFGKEYELCFGKDLIRYDDKEAGLYSFVLQTNKYSIRINGVLFKTGDSVSKFRTLPAYKSERKQGDEIVIFLNYEDGSPICVRVSGTGVITQISYEIQKG